PMSPAVRVAAGPAIAAGESVGSDFSPWSGAVPMGTAVSMPSMPPVAEPAFGAPASAMPAVADPIAQAPEAVWYVRPPSGGQYGPARGDVMRRWIDEGRVTADSLLWRDGWVDWQEAAHVFPGLNGAADLPSAGTGLPAAVFPLPDRPATPAAARAGRTRRKKSPYVGVAIVAVLVLVSLGLLVTLVWVLSNR
ncbi:MAG: DUF4339 domain-containing protein, partial [Pirellulaceae bacterium]|nr:DUF4339 domain-containing protein [Pirellulaceae bacterium]